MSVRGPASFAFGGVWQPERRAESAWDEDLASMTRAGATAVAFGRGVWPASEPSPEAFDFGLIDRALERCAAHGLSVCFITPTAEPPAWLAREAFDGPSGEAFGRRQARFTPNSDDYREAARRMVATLARRYGGHPAIVAWRIAAPPSERAECGGDADRAAFQAWLRDKYGGTAAWAAAWFGSSNAWSGRWTDIPLPDPRDKNLALGPWLDFRRFVSDAWLERFETERELVRKHAPEIPVLPDFNASETVRDRFAWAPRVDLAGLDLPPLPEGEEAVRAAFAFDMARSLRRSPFWLAALAPAAQPAPGMESSPRHGRMRLRAHQAIARGADGLFFAPWRPADAGERQFRPGIADGDDGGRALAEARQIGSEVDRLAPVAGASTHADCALLHDDAARWAAEAPGLPRAFDHDAVARDFHAAFHRLNLPVDFVAPNDPELQRYRLVIAPSLPVLRREDAERIGRFVESGGVFASGFFTGVADENGVSAPGGPPGFLREVLGLRVETWRPSAGELDQRMKMDDGRLVKCGYFSEAIRLETAEPLAVFAGGALDGAPGLTVNLFGQGRAYYIATRAKPSFYQYALRELIGRLGLERPLRDTPADVEAGLRSGANGEFLFLLNHSNEPRPVELGALGGVDLLTGRRVEGRLSLAGGDVAALRLDPKDRRGLV